ncbi:MAG: GAF domain-containing sensor histidine kinase [Anaerolineales bacterium]|nr:GAF domain-containing sensor histidine kinase [Chloroflexota bacterium]MBL6981651.1 GAF domain-containing sensor histidine kinase [Anaerolineales bacterium]
MVFDIFSLIHIISALIFLILLIIVISQRGLLSDLARHLNIFIIIYMFLEAVLVLKYGEYNFLNFLPGLAGAFWPGSGILLGSLLLRYISAQVARREMQFWRGDLIGGAWYLLAVGALFIPGIEKFGVKILGLELNFEILLLAWILLGWLIATGLTIRLIAESYQHASFPTIRNRLFIFGLGLGVLLIGNGFSFASQVHIGSIVALVGVLTIAYVVITPRLPHLGIALRGLINKGLYLILQFGAYSLSFILIQFLLSSYYQTDLFFAAAILALLIIGIINPLLKRLGKWVDRLFFGEEQDLSGILREYSQNISNILDLELLSAVVVDMVRDLLGVDRGLLFLVELEVSPDGKKVFRVQQGRKRKDASLTGFMPSESALASAWDKDRRALTRAEIDMLPRYQSIQADTRQWLTRVSMDIYVPIHAQDEWVGLLALGPKASGASYLSDDIELLCSMADQTAVALQNARLVESLMRVNTEFRRAYSAMEDGHSKLKRLDRTKSDFISIASHELRTPLTVLSGYSQMLLDAPELKSNPAYVNALEGVVDGAQRLHEIVDSMLEVAKIDTQELALQADSVKLEPVISNVCRKFAATFRERKLKVLIDRNVDDLPSVLGDPDALTKVFQHLISNAVKYTPDEGLITISGRHLKKGLVKFPRGGVEIQVKDTGIGIDPRNKELIFTKFYQTGDLALHSTGKTKFKGGGPGLGLAIVRGIVQAHGGRVWAESSGYDESRNPGSSFYVILPIYETVVREDEEE